MIGTRAPSRQPGPSGLSKLWTWLLLAAVTGGFAAYLHFQNRNAGGEGGGITASMIEEGATLYGRHCAACHGPGGGGENPAQPMGGLKPDGVLLAPALNGTGHMWHHPPDALFGIVRNGSFAQGSPMKGWRGRLSDREIRSVLGFLRSLWPEELQQRYRNTFGDG